MSLSLSTTKKEREKDGSVYNKRRAVIKTFAQQQQKKQQKQARALFEVQETPLELFLLKKMNEISKI
jgi:hypothetical protein